MTREEKAELAVKISQERYAPAFRAFIKVMQKSKIFGGIPDVPARFVLDQAISCAGEPGTEMRKAWDALIREADSAYYAFNMMSRDDCGDAPSN